ncbi:putative T6SS immunity periplasmic lipoprotein [Serratia ficaria]|uniref:DUF7480 domain-containing protein n=1 Tax=Serratia ficaria TaxID=61651 RepID=A0A240B335_SERFI|nr:putative T6SS immunity periplasmic lipoprotein [Serratia ficaria]REF46190.1 hypothetical protein C7332_4563 [Serratia ficaria]CAI0872634.1 Uncharacterised protein [Serratia ficaria]CAI1000356.1 Uncharacterised protein [Serratia ficaria]CAI1014027.1 Uncharacterised protein [Serratia ficaria]CAI2052553.1 Uncharacterised protein [Serratia ficaria]
MNRIIFSGTLTLLLSGCMHINDPRPRNYTADVTAFDNQVCVRVQPEGDERLSGIIIEELGNANAIFGKNFIDNEMPAVTSDKCIPDFNYKFEDGKSYGVSVTLLSREKRSKGIEPAARLFGAGFSVRNENGIIQVVPAH